MALRVPGLKREDSDDDAVVVAVIPRREAAPGAVRQNTAPLPGPGPLEAADACEEPKEPVPWEHEFLVGDSPGGSGRALCMVCGAVIWAPSADTARAHILEQHPHTLDLSRAEKSNILEAWGEGVALLRDPEPPPALPSFSPDPGTDGDPDPGLEPTKAPAEIVVLLDSEDGAALPRRVRPRGLRPLELRAPPAADSGTRKPRGQRAKEAPGDEPARKKRGGRAGGKMLDLEPQPAPELTSPDSPAEAFEAPLEVRHFTDGPFPAGFAFQLFSRTHLGAPRKTPPREERAAPADARELRGTVDLQVIRMCAERPPARRLLPDWPQHLPRAKAVGAGDPARLPAGLPRASASAGGPPEAGRGV